MPAYDSDGEEYSSGGLSETELQMDKDDLDLINENPNESRYQNEDIIDDAMVYEMYWNDPGWRYWRSDEKLPVQLFDNSEIISDDVIEDSINDNNNLTKVNEEEKEDKDECYTRLLNEEVSKFETTMNTIKKVLQEWDNNLINWDEWREQYLKLEPMSQTFFNLYQTPFCPVLKEFLKERIDMIQSSLDKSRPSSVYCKPTPAPNTTEFLLFEPIGITKARDIRAALKSKELPFSKVSVSYVDFIPLGNAYVKADPAHHNDIISALNGHKFDGFSPCKVSTVVPIDLPPTKEEPKPEQAISRKKQRAMLKRKMIEDLRNYFTSSDGTPNLETQDIYFIDFECVVTGRGYAIPSELAITKYNLRYGFSDNTYHTFIHPGIIPPQLEDIAAKVTLSFPPTGIPYKNFALANYNYEEIWDNITSILNPNDIIVAKGPQTEYYCLQWIADRVGAKNPYNLIYDYGDLISAFGLLAGNEPQPQELVEMLRMVAKFLYEDIRCEYHTELLLEMYGNRYHCSLCDVRALGYTCNWLVNHKFPSLVKSPLVEQEPMEKTNSEEDYQENENNKKSDPPKSEETENVVNT